MAQPSDIHLFVGNLNIKLANCAHPNDDINCIIHIKAKGNGVMDEWLVLTTEKVNESCY